MFSRRTNVFFNYRLVVQYIIYNIIISLFVVGCADSVLTKIKPPADLVKMDYPLDTQVTKSVYYRFPTYNVAMKQYDFDASVTISPESIQKHSFYYKAYLNKHYQLVRFDRFDWSKMTESHVLNHSKSQDSSLQWNVYFPDGTLDRTIYMDAKLKINFMHKLDAQQNPIQYVNVQHTKQGMSYYFYDAFTKRYLYNVRLNKHRQVKSITYYLAKSIQKQVTYYYDSMQRLMKKKEQNPWTKQSTISIYQYQNEYQLGRVQTYQNRNLLSEVVFDDLGRESTRKRYSKISSKIDQIIQINYHKNGYTKRYFNSLRGLKALEEWTPKQRLLKKVYYDKQRAIYRELQYQYDSQSNRLTSVEMYENKGLAQKELYDASGKIEQREIYRQKQLNHREHFNYNQYNQLVKIIAYLPNKERLFQIDYQYTKNGLIVEKKMKQDKKVEKTDQYQYYPSGNLKIHDCLENNLLRRRSYYNTKGQVYKVEARKGDLILQKILKRYQKNGLLEEEVFYDRVGQVEKHILFTYNNDGYKIQEDGYDGKRQYVGSIKFSYGQLNHIRKKDYYNYERQMYKSILFDQTGKPILN